MLEDIRIEPKKLQFRTHCTTLLGLQQFLDNFYPILYILKFWGLQFMDAFISKRQYHNSHYGSTANF